MDPKGANADIGSLNLVLVLSTDHRKINFYWFSILQNNQKKFNYFVRFDQYSLIYKNNGDFTDKLAETAKAVIPSFQDFRKKEIKYREHVIR